MLKQESIKKQRNAETENTNPKFQLQATFEKKSDFEKNSFIFSRQKYPDLRFSCPNCGTLDVLIEWHPQDYLRGMCLDCHIDWNE